MKTIYKAYKKIVSLNNRIEQLEKRDSLSQETLLEIEKLRESIEKYEILIEKHRRARRTSQSLEALYFPFSRITDINALKKAIFVFDKLWFLDSLEQEMRNVALTKKSSIRGYYPFSKLREAWKALEDDYKFLIESGEIELYDTSEIAYDFEPVIGNSLKKDLLNESYLKLFPSNPVDNTWCLLKEDFPWESAKDLLRLESNIVEYGQNPRAIGVNQAFTSTPGFDYTKLPNGTKMIFVHPVQGTSIKITQALIISIYENIPLFTNREKYLTALLYKLDSGKFSPLSEELQNFYGSSNLNRINYKAALTFEIVNKLVNEEIFANKSIHKIVEYKNKCSRARTKFYERVSEVCTQLETDTLFSLERLNEIIEKYIVPEAYQFSNAMSENYERVFESALGITTTALIGGISGSILMNVILPNQYFNHMLMTALETTSFVVAPTVISRIANFLLKRKFSHDNSFIYLMDL